MSIAAADRKGSREAEPRGYWVAVGFLLLLLLALSWPAPVITINEALIDAPLSINDDSFLGREAPSWDVAFWMIAGLFTLSLFHGRTSETAEGLSLLKYEVRSAPRRVVERWRAIRLSAVLTGAALAVIATASVWFLLDSTLMGQAESFQSDWTRAITRILNRFGGGMNPVLIVGFFLAAGVSLARRRWIELSIAMVAAALGGGILVQLIKTLVGRSRPELWLGPFHHARAAASSFPSGHTVGAFAIAAGILFGLRSPTLRILALTIALGIGIARIMAFRHWPSDVVASGIIGVALAWFFVSAIVREDTGPQ